MNKDRTKWYSSMWFLGSCNNIRSDHISYLGFHLTISILSTDNVRSPSPIWSYQFLRLFRSPIWFYQFSTYLWNEWMNEGHDLIVSPSFIHSLISFELTWVVVDTGGWLHIELVYPPVDGYPSKPNGIIWNSGAYSNANLTITWPWPCSPY